MTSRSLVLLSGEKTTLARAEAKALFLAYDQATTFESPEDRVLLAASETDPFVVGSRIAFSRRVGIILSSPSDAQRFVQGKKFRLRVFDIRGQRGLNAEEFLRGVEGEVDLVSPDYEITLVRGASDYLALTVPQTMMQGWSRRRPRARAFFHPSAIFPKLSRAMVNLTRCRAGEVFLDPFSGTGSLPLEAAIIGARVVALDQVSKMARGSLANMKRFAQEWLGVVRADSFNPPLVAVDAVATDVPYGRVSSTRGVEAQQVLMKTLAILPRLIRANGRVVIMHPKLLNVGDPVGLEIEEAHDLYVHKLLTRTITVLRKK